MQRIGCVWQSVPSNSQKNKLFVRHKADKQREDKVHAGPIHPINKDPAVPEPPEHRLTLLLLRRRD